MRRVALWLGLAGLLGLGACSFLDESPPGKSCSINADCFTAQGESCDKIKHQCVGGTVIDSGTPIDASTPIDAQPLDSQIADGGTD